MILITLAIILLIICFLIYILRDFDPISPSLLFCGGFAACLVSASFFSQRWNYEMTEVAFVVILSGCLIFVVSARLCKQTTLGHPTKANIGDYRLPSSKIYLAALVAFVLVVMLISLRFILQEYPSDSLSGSVARFNSALKFTDEGANVFPSPWDKLRNLALMAGYLFAFYLAQSAIERDKSTFIIALIGVTVASLSQILSASRTMAVGYIFCFVVSYIMLRRHRDGCLPKVTVKTILLVIVVISVFLISFQFIAQAFQGRTTSSDPFVYISAYIGAEIPNLDSFLKTNGADANPAIWGYMTFRNTIRWLGEQFGIANFIYQYDLPFNTINGVSLGNVYTTFYAFIYDFGYVGLVFLTVLMAFVSQAVYSKSCKFNSGWVSSVWVIIYSIIAYALLLSFFSNKFYENVFVVTFVFKLVYLLILYIPILFLSKAKPSTAGVDLVRRERTT